MEYILLLGGILVLLALVMVFMQGTLFAPQAKDIEAKNNQFRDLTKQLQTPATPTPASSPKPSP